jgi:CubicO group peptidase (beta-lactamase class C family)
MKKAILILMIVSLSGPATQPGFAQTEDPGVKEALNLLEIWVDAQLDYKGIPGMSMGVVYDQKLIWSKGFGFAHPDQKVAASPDTIYSICSISKLFTSISIMQLRHQKKLSLDDPIQVYLPWFKLQDRFPDAPEITLRGILTHSAGLPREADYPYWTGPDYPFPTREQIIEGLARQEELYPADLYFQYSNLGMSLAGEVVREVSGISFADYVTRNILEPLGLSSTFPEIPSEHAGGKLATPYTSPLRDGKRREIPFYHVNGIAPAAGFASTVNDLARFASWQFRLLEKGGEEILPVNTLREMQRVHWLDPNWETTWGFGFSVSQREGKIYVGHGGSCPGYKTQLLLCPKDKIAVIVMSNGSDVNTGDYVRQIFDVITKPLIQAVKSPEKAKKADPELEQFVGHYQHPLSRETYAVIWEGELALFSVPTDNPNRSITKLKHIEKNIFRSVRDDGELAEKVIFEINPQGEVTRLIRNSNYAVKVK